VHAEQIFLVAMEEYWKALYMHTCAMLVLLDLVDRKFMLEKLFYDVPEGVHVFICLQLLIGNEEPAPVSL
jgi:hypothetical protein